MTDILATLWLAVATILVLSMQAGFLMLEGGRVRAKNSINVAQKNITDLIVVWVMFFACGLFLMFGLSVSDLSASQDSTFTPLHAIYQFAFCTTAATIVSGAIAERFSFKAYLLVVVFIGALLYPLVGRMVWGNTYNPEVNAYLANIGFIDFAGSTVVHGVGAWVALVAAVMVGPRNGRFDKQGNPKVMPAFNAVISLFGVLILIIGWLGFNAGAISPADPRLGLVLFCTFTAGVFGGVAGMAIGYVLDKGVFNPGRVTNGLLGGLVASTAGVVFMEPGSALWIGLGGGAIAVFGSQVLLVRCKLDDPLDCVAVHGLAGVFGTLAVAFIMPMETIASQSRLTQLGIQGAGVALIFAFTVLATWLVLKTIDRFISLRVPEEAERLGLNYTEHGECVGLNRLKNTLQSKLDTTSSFASGIDVSSEDEHSELASTLNEVILRYESANNEIQNAQQRFRHFAETASDWLWEADENLNLTFLHTSAQSDYGDGSLNELLGKNLTNVLDLQTKDLDTLQTSVKNGHATPVIEATLNNHGSPTHGMSVEFRAVPCHNQETVVTGFRGTLSDVSLRKSAEHKALYLSLHDELTGLPNRRALSRDLVNAMRRAEQTAATVVVAGVDLDGFKAINDAYGHAVGDELLSQVSQRLQHFLRPIDLVYRTGGDEFVVVFDSFDSQTATQMAKSVTNRLIRHISEPYAVDTLTLQVGASVGLSRYPQDDQNAQDLLRMADLALYAAKDAGKGCVVSFLPEHDTDAEFQRQMEQDLRRAITDNEFYLMYQPQVDTVSEKVIGYEALIRWKHPQRGEISPGDFIPVAEKLNLMDSIGEFVLDNAIAFAASWPEVEDGIKPRISVNVSPKQFSTATFVKQVMGSLEHHSLDPTRLELEITEDVLVDNFVHVSHILKQLRSHGIAIAVDDFGSGQTSLRYLNQFPLSTIKIDRSFICNLGHSDKAAEITRTVVMLGQKLGINVIAEGVEKTDQLNLLRQWNCDQIQGFLFSRPQSIEEVSRDMLNTSSGTYRKAG